MPNFKIIGTDLKEYGPVSVEQIRQWIAEGRVDSQTKLQAEGGGEWKRLAEVPEFAAPLKGNGSRCCPNCGEPFAEGFDSCWKCGTNKDGSPAKEWTPVEDVAKGVAVELVEPCPKCGNRNVRRGKLLPAMRDTLVIFKPEGTRLLILSPLAGVALSSDSSCACLDCGLVWDYLQPGELKEFISKNCRELDQ
jgi:hypothetical protein